MRFDQKPDVEPVGRFPNCGHFRATVTRDHMNSYSLRNKTDLGGRIATIQTNIKRDGDAGSLPTEGIDEMLQPAWEQ